MKNILTDSTKEFEIEVWYREKKGWYHICPQCGTGFFGRKNQIYCPGGQCKGVFNRSKNARVKTLAANAQNRMLKNRMILESLLRQRKISGMPDKKVLLNNGFDFDAPGEQRHATSGLILKVYLDFGLWIDPKTETAFIFKFSIGDPRYQKFDGSLSSYFSIIQ